MKKYYTLSELLLDYRKYNNLSQSEIAAMLDVDVRTISRWEKNESLINPEKEMDFAGKLFLPYQVVRNLNSTVSIPVYYDIKNRTYSLAALMNKIESASWFKSKFPVDNNLIRTISGEEDVDFVINIQQKSNNAKPVKQQVIAEAAKLLPDINIVIFDQSGFYAGFLSVFPLRYDIYRKIREGDIDCSSIAPEHLTMQREAPVTVFFLYSVYADSLTTAFYLMNPFISYFRTNKFKNYIFAGISYRENQIELLKEMGLKVIREKTEVESTAKVTLLEGNLDMFLFGKML